MSERIASIDLRRVKVSDLKPHPRNPREHPKPGSPLWEVLKRSLDHDYFDPLVWSEANGFLVSGHLRLKFLAELGFTLVDVSAVNLERFSLLGLPIEKAPRHSEPRTAD